MADGSAIEWTDATWNPVTGCTKITAGCDNCYAARFSERWRGIPGHPFENGFDLTLRPERIGQPIAWKRSRMIFVNSMSDLFHKEVPLTFIDQVFDTMEKADWHVFQVLTKRSSLMRDYLSRRYRTASPPAHIWLGVSVEDSRSATRIAHLRQAPAAVRFLSVEPLIGAVGSVDLTGIHWVIAGGESGPGARPFGTSDWETRFYEHQPAPTDLFDFAPPTGPSRNADPEKVERFAAERLRSIFSFVSQPIPILTRRKLRQFSLFLLSGNSNERAIALIKKGVSAQIKKFEGR